VESWTDAALVAKGFDDLMRSCTSPSPGRFVAYAVALAVWSSTSVRAQDLGLRAPEGFTVSLYADDDLAHDIHCLTFDARGRVVVSGPGYVKILVDHDRDGRADDARLFAEPKAGAQGMYFHGADLLCSAEGGLVRYRDRDADDAADGPPEVFLRMETGGEHDAHAIHRGPDGCWYLIAGNVSGIGAQYITTETSPVAQPRAGVLLRLAPDLSKGEVVAHGFRNAYDFTFDAVGELFTCDSDGERDVSLPWYLPSRVLHVLPGSDAGWVSESWKRHDEFPDMPPVLASLGRGSPTGVICYRHAQFPAEYHSALFILDWTYGRVQTLRLKQRGSTVVSEPVDFLTSVGAHGFAPTSGAIGPDGALYIAVGGRGTRGGVYRIASTSRPAISVLDRQLPTGVSEKLTLCLRCPEPLSSWSRRLWEPLAKDLGSEAFIHAAQDENRAAIERLRAIEILTELFNGPDSDLLAMLGRSSRPAVRARAAWALGRTQTMTPRVALAEQFLADAEPFVVRSALESLLGADQPTLAQLVTPLAAVLGSPDPYIRQTAVRVIARADEDAYQAIAAEAAPTGWQAGLSLALAYAIRHEGVDPYTLDVALRVLNGSHPLELRREAVRALQLGLGDCGPATFAVRPRRPTVFDAYASTLDLSGDEAVVTALRAKLRALYPSGDAALDRELARTLAMVQPADSELNSKLLAPISAESHPVDDLHQLIVLARLPGERTAVQREHTAAAIIGLDTKVKQLGLMQDLHWDDRVLEMYGALVAADPLLPVALLQHAEFGRPGHAQFLTKLDPSHFETAVNVFANAALAGGADYEWNGDIVYLLTQSTDPRVRNLVRAQFEDYGLRGSVLLALAENPTEADRGLFVAGLESSQFEVLSACIRALALLPPSPAAAENVTLVRTLRRLGFTDQEAMFRDQIVEALRRNTGQTDSYQLGRPGEAQQAAVTQWSQVIERAFPEEFQRQTGSDAGELAALQRILAGVPPTGGSVERGERLFRQRACVQCHSSGRALGPDLHGVTHRFSRDDLFTAIALPSRDVSPRYQAELILTKDGETYTGLVVYNAIDGLVLRDANNRTYRIEAADIEVRRKLTTSLMPAGLLKDLQPGDLADLYAYLEQLSQRPAEQTAQVNEAVE
jgi:putative membrane-bound dehydrogenase-like protein